MAETFTAYTFNGNPRIQKILLAAKYAGLTVSVSHQQTPKHEGSLESSSFDCSPIVVSSNGTALSHTNTIIRHFARLGNPSLLGNSPYQHALVDQWLDFVFNEVDLASVCWLFPILGFIPENAQATSKAKSDIRSALSIINSHLLHHTFLVGERITLADIALASSLFGLYTRVLDTNFRKAFVNVNRWFLTCLAQPHFVEVFGQNVTLCTKMEFAPKPAASEETKEKEPKKKNEKQQKNEKPQQQKNEKQQKNQKQAEKPAQPAKGKKEVAENAQPKTQNDNKQKAQVSTDLPPATLSVEIENLTINDSFLVKTVVAATSPQAKKTTSTTGPSSITFSNGSVVTGDVSVARLLARAYPLANLNGQDTFSTTEVDEWIKFAEDTNALNLEVLNEHLILRTFLAGHRLSIADLVVANALQGQNVDNRFAHVSRWLSYVNHLANGGDKASPQQVKERQENVLHQLEALKARVEKLAAGLLEEPSNQQPETIKSVKQV